MTKYQVKNKAKFFLFIILFYAGLMRFFGNNWDHGYHLHPDERMIIMVADKIKFFKQLNPNFFNYGSLPIYCLKGVSQLIDYLSASNLSNYDGMLIVGRMIVSCLDIFLIVIIFKLAQIIFNSERLALYASFFYAIAFFPIQNSNFFVVDNFINFLLSLLILFLIKYSYQQSYKYIFYAAMTYAALLASKFTPIIFFPLIVITIFSKIKNYQLTFQIKSLTSWKKLAFFLIIFFGFNFLFMPYTYLNFKQFYTDIKLQTQMNSDAYIFPYTLQYVGTLPYWYYLKNIALWGIGPISFALFSIGLACILLKLKKTIQTKNINWSLVFYLLINCYYFIFIGRSAVKFMRYMLPLYPFLSIIAAYGFDQLNTLTSKKINLKFQQTIKYLLLFLSITWTLSFLNIYSQTHTRVAATNWILANIPKGSKIAIEHWDDQIPITQAQNYQFLEMTLYDLPDDQQKWFKLKQKLQQANYLIIASNRLYTPLQKLKDCEKYLKCYPKTAQYYQDLFAGKLNFYQVADFTTYPSLPLLNHLFVIKDDPADESFTVYDHPRVIIFKKKT